MNKHLEKNVLSSFKKKSNLTFSSLGLNEAALLGAASLVWTNKKKNKKKS
jgi:LPXTG-motif cell wall-anchored protein